MPEQKWMIADIIGVVAVRARCKNGRPSYRIYTKLGSYLTVPNSEATVTAEKFRPNKLLGTGPVKARVLVRLAKGGAEKRIMALRRVV